MNTHSIGLPGKCSSRTNAERDAPLPEFGSTAVAKYGAVGLGTPQEHAARKALAQPQKMGNTEAVKMNYEVQPYDRLPLISGLAHHIVDNAHLWIAVEDGKLIVCDDTDNILLQEFTREASPIAAASALAAQLSLPDEDAWNNTLAFIGRLAAAGFIVGIKGYHSVKRAKPQAFARFHLTQRCQLECIHCYTNSSPHLSSANELTTERWIKLVEDFADNGGERILFTGGEALVHRGCIDIMRRAHERGLEVTLFSNGILVQKHLADLRNVADIVQISIDGPTAESHDLIRGPGSFRKAIASIHLLLDAGITTRISTTIMMNNWHSIKADLPKLIQEFENKKVSFRISYGAMSHGRGEKLDHALDYKEVRSFVDDLLNKVNPADSRTEGHNVVQKITGCGYAEQLVVAPDGLVYPCHLLSGALGHVDQLPLGEITNYLARTAEAFSVANRVGCGTCDLRNLCGGSCRIEDEKQTMSRLVTTCTAEDKLRKKRFLVSRYHAEK